MRSLKFVTSWLMIVSGFNVLFGWLREFTVAYYYGISNELEVYLVAVRIPQIIGIEVLGITVTVLLPIYVSIKTKQGSAAAKVQAKRWTWRIIGIIAVAGAAVYILAPYICHLLAPGFNSEQLAKAAKWMRLAIPIMLFLGLSGMAKLILDSHKRFFFPAFSKGVGSLFFILICVVLSGKISGVNLLFAMLASSVAILLFSSIPLLGRLLSGRPDGGEVPQSYSPPNGRMVGLVLIVGFNSVIFHFYSLIDMHFASTLTQGSIAILNYGNLLISVPSTLFSMVIATVLFPVFSEQFTKRDYGHSITLIKKSLVLCAVCYVGVAVMMVLFSRPFVSILLERGNFKAGATVSVATVLAILAIGLVPSGLWDIVRVFFRAQNLHIYMLHVALIVLAGKVVFNLALYRYGVNGLAVSSAVTTWLGYAYLQYRLVGNLRMLRAPVIS